MKINISISILFFILNNLVKAESKFQVDIDSKGLQGEYRIEHSYGNPAVIGKFKNGKRIGIWKAFHANGSLFYSRNFKNGLEEGLSSYWDANGKKIVEGNYKRGWKVGDWKFFYPDGSIKAVGICERNTFHKEWMFYSKYDTVTYTYSLGRTTFANNHWYGDTMKMMLVKSFTSISMVVNGHKRFMWLLNSIDDYQLEYDLNENGLPHGMYAFSLYQCPNNLKDFLGEMSSASFINGVKHGIQNSYFYKVSAYTNKERKANNAKYRKQKRENSYPDLGAVHYKVKNKRKYLSQWYRPFKKSFSFGFEDVAILSGINDMGNFKGKFYSEKTGRKPTYIDERKDSFILIDNFYKPEETKEKYKAFDSLCLISRNYRYPEKRNKNTIIEEWNKSIFVRNNLNIYDRIKLLYNSNDTAFKIIEYRDNQNYFFREENYVLNPAYFYPVTSYQSNLIGYTTYIDSYSEWGSYSYPINTLPHGRFISRYGLVVYEEYYNYGFLTEIKFIN